MRGVLTALIVLTRIPVRVPGELTDDDLAAALPHYALVGVGVGLVEGAAVWLLVDHLPALVVGALAVLASIALTGAFHEDALGDVADGFGGGWTRDRVLEIMRDSRLGTYGVLAVALALLIRVGCLPELGLLPIVLAHALSRAILPALLTAGRPARPDGFVAALAGRVPQTAMVALIATALIAVLALGTTGLAMVAAVFGVGAAVHAFSHARIQGLTGDVLGSAQQMALLAVLLIATYAS